MAIPEVTSPRPRFEQLVLLGAGMLLLASGCLHVPVWLVDGTSLAGPVSWRKPILFGISAGVTLLSLAWVVGKMRRRTGDFLLLAILALAMVIEVGLITLQQWRGVPSHFNRSSAFDSFVLTWIEALIVVVTIVIVELTRRSFQPLHASPDITLAIRSGMALLLLSCLLGFVLVAWGNHQVAQGRSPETFGDAGVMKFPHGVPMHAIQFFPVLAWLLKKLGVGEGQRTQAVAYATGSTVAFLVFSLLQTFTGRGRLELWWLSTIVLVLSAALLLVAVWTGIAGMIRFLANREVPPSRTERGSLST